MIDHSVDSLIQGIETIILKNSSSFSSVEIDVLRQCAVKLKELSSKEKNENQGNNLEIVKTVAEIMKIFTNPDVIDFFNDLFK